MQKQEITAIHSLQLIAKDADKTFFSLDDVETTYSSYQEENSNLSFIEDSFML